METLIRDLFELLVRKYFEINASLALLCTSKKFYTWGIPLQESLLNAKNKKMADCLDKNDIQAFYIRHRIKSKELRIHTFRDIFEKCCQLDHFEIAQFMFQTHKPLLLETKKNSLARLIQMLRGSDEDHLKKICRKQNIKFMAWYIKICDDLSCPINLHINNESILRICCKTGNIKLVRWLLNYAKTINSPINIHANREKAFDESCSALQFHMAEFLLQLSFASGSSIDIHVDNEYIFRTACLSNNLKSAKYLVELGNKLNSPIDLHADHDDAFQSSCIQGYLDCAQWLFQLSLERNTPFDIHINGDYLFIKCCRHGNLQIVQWLVSLGDEHNFPIDFILVKEYAFITACYMGHFKLCEWLFIITEQRGLLLNLEIILHSLLKEYQKSHLVDGLVWFIEICNAKQIVFDNKIWLSGIIQSLS